jgi:hypothetical protein
MFRLQVRDPILFTFAAQYSNTLSEIIYEVINVGLSSIFDDGHL